MNCSVEEAACFLKGQDRILILCHRNPDGDTLGCGYGLYHALKAMGKSARLLCSDPPPQNLRYLTGGYVEADFPPNAVVSVDIADEQLFGDGLAGYLGKVDLAIDHHLSHQPFASRILLEPDSAAACEIVCQVIRAMGLPFTPEVAACLYTGMATDTGCFRYGNTTPRTHRLAAEMMEAGCPYQKINKTLFETKSPALMAVEREALNTMEFHFGGKAALIVISAELLSRCALPEQDLGNISALPRTIEGVEVGITIKERGPGEYKLSLRSNEFLDVSALCQSFGGGGHVRAAGCTIYGSLEEVKALLLGAVGRALEEYHG